MTANGGEQDVVPDEGIEPPTFGLQNRCSTAELTRRFQWALLCRRRGWIRRASRLGAARVCNPVAAHAASDGHFLAASAAHSVPRAQRPLSPLIIVVDKTAPRLPCVWRVINV